MLLLCNPLVAKGPDMLLQAHMRRTLFRRFLDAIGVCAATQLSFCNSGTINCERRKGPGLTLMVGTPSIFLSFSLRLSCG